MTFMKWSLITLNEFRTIKLCPAPFPSYIGCVIAKSSTELQSRHLGKVGTVLPCPQKVFACLFIYFKQMTPLTSKSLQTNGNCSSPAGISASCSFAPID